MKCKKFLTKFSWLLIIIPAIFVFKHILFGKLPTWGDAPFFYPEGLKELFSEPLTWVGRGANFGGVNNILWIYPLMFLFGLLNKLFSFGSDFLVRLVFYFPSLIFAFIGPLLLTRYLKLSKITQFFSVLTYLLSTYYILLVDGGQIGISLAYGLFPLIILLGKKMLDSFNLKTLIGFILISFILCLVDPRISIISFLTLFVWQAVENWKKVYSLFIAGILLIPLNFYWILPLIKIKGEALSTGVTGLQLSSLLNAFFLYAPHWPDNIFGKVVQPSFYFILIPIFIFGALTLKRKSKLVFTLTLCFLIFAFISKGSSAPFGIWYDYLMKLPFGFAFRDSSKFFIPLILFGGILIGEMVEEVGLKIKIFPVLTYLYLLFLIYPALLGKLNFNLSSRSVGGDYGAIYQNLKDKQGFFGTLWFPEKHPLGYEIAGKEVIGAKDIILSKPFAFINASEDPYNFLNNSSYVDWLRVLGVKYLFLSGDQRNIRPTEKDVKDWTTIKSLVSETSGLKQLNWGTSIPSYEIEKANLPKFYFVKNLIAVVGPMLEKPVASVYLEDGKVDVDSLMGKNKDSVKILFNSKEKVDLTMVFLKNYFTSVKESAFYNWAFYEPGDFLKAKYELLIRGFK
ncbi:MAG: hypothetical protein NTV24_03780, partial [Candidatus Woesebacteria bacterium]|nr:hypothetical protein [Candidatus Woesebacteria bacterium]